MTFDENMDLGLSQQEKDDFRAEEERYEREQDYKAEREEPYRDEFFNSFTTAELIEFLKKCELYNEFEKFDKSDYASEYLAVKDYVEMYHLPEFFDYFDNEFHEYISDSW